MPRIGQTNEPWVTYLKLSFHLLARWACKSTAWFWEKMRDTPTSKPTPKTQKRVDEVESCLNLSIESRERKNRWTVLMCPS